jgi:cyclopropane fatty-acyl-phospholipid synthase-like methyltransferase
MIDDLKKILRSEKVIVELGMGDGSVLQKLAEDQVGSQSVAYVGIEKDKNLTDHARMRVKLQNVTIINELFENTLIRFNDQSIDLIVMVLPDPEYIDSIYQQKWGSFYKVIHSKLKDNGILKIVTEIIDDLLEPVSDESYSTHVNWLIKAFLDLGFKLLDRKDGSPLDYTSIFLDKFRADPHRIRIVTLDFGKSNSRKSFSV